MAGRGFDTGAFEATANDGRLRFTHDVAPLRSTYGLEVLMFGTPQTQYRINEVRRETLRDSAPIADAHKALVEKPEAVNSDPHGSWMIALRITGGGDDLLDPAQYAELTK